MSPSPQECETRGITIGEGADRDRVVISGISGLFPKARHIKDLADILYNKVDPIETDISRWNYVHPEMVPYMGKIPNVDRFDCQFFRVSNHLVFTMDAMSRKLLEQTYQAIYDAGLSPEHLQGKDVGVYIASCYSETDKASFYNDFKNGVAISGTSKAMFANRISYWLNLKGPSMALDQSCCGSVMALEEAVKAIKRGEIEAAIVGGSNLCLHPQALVHYGRVIKLSEDGKTKSFDANANGCVKSEAISVIFLQKAKDALRIYASVVHVKSEFNGVLKNDGGPVYGFYRDPIQLSNYLKNFYKEAGISPREVEYVEAFGAGIPEVDEAELKALDTVFCRNRSNALSIGSVTSNIGYTESASGLSALTKVLLAYQTGKISATLHYRNPRREVTALRDGKIRIISNNEAFERTYVAINNLSINGSNAHVLLKGEYKPKQFEKKSSIPYLVTASGRQESAIEMIFDDIKKRPIDPEELALFHHIHEKRINGHLSRGYAIFDTKEGKTVYLDKKVERFDDSKRPLWFVYSGMGSQWVGMGAQLMRIPRFAQTMKRIQKALEPKGIDIIDIITTSDKTILDSIVHSFVGISAIQIALTDVLKEMGIVPDNIIGHSLGELGCAYGDGCFTVEEMILSSYYRGRVANDIPVVKGAMAAVGLGYQQLRDLCPPGIVVACHNGPDSCTISGPAVDMEKFIEKLQSNGIFAKAVSTGNLAFHSPYVAPFGESHLSYLREVITPRERSERWLSTSVPPERWHEPAAKFSCAEYHNNNMMNPVLFEEVLRSVPPNAVLIEIAPHGLLQPILKRSVSPDCRNIALTRRGHPDNVLHLLNAVGQLYMEGFNPKIANLYPKVEFPVSTATPSLSHLVEWIHDEKWELPLYDAGDKKLSTSSKFYITLHDNEYKYLEGCVVRGKTVLPFAAAIVALWDTMSIAFQLPMRQSVQLRDVQLFSQPILHEQRLVRLSVSLHRGTGQFEISDDVTKVATGYITREMPDLKGVFKDDHKELEPLELESEDIYTLLEEKDYSYSGEFRSIFKANLSLNEAQMIWHDNWVTLIDGMLQLNALRQNHSTVSHPVLIRRLCIDVKEHAKCQVIKFGDKKLIRTMLNQVHDFTRCGGILLENVKHHNLPPSIRDSLTLKPIMNSERKGHQSSCKYRTVLRNTCIGDIHSLHWETEAIEESDLGVQVHYAGIHDMDLRKATGTIPVSNRNAVGYGMDFSGKTISGQNVMGVVHGGALSSTVRAQPELLWNVPDNWTLEDAATVPLAYCFAFYCLDIKAKLTPGMNVFILGGTGAMGQAAITIALARGCRVFTAVSSNSKKQLLLKLFPKLNENDIGDSLNSSFYQMVIKGTRGKGADIVINNAVGDLKNVALSCCAGWGITIDTTLSVTKDRFSFGLNYLKNQKTYISVDFSSIFTHSNLYDMKILHNLMKEGLERGYIQPLTRTVYEPADVTHAFKILKERSHHGHLLVRLEGIVPEVYSCSPIPLASRYLVVCEDDFGLRVVDRLVNHGIKTLYLHYPKATGQLQFKLQQWLNLGVNVKTFTDDLHTLNNVQKFIYKTEPALLDGVFIISTSCNKNSSLNNCVLADLDSASRDTCSQLRHFVIINDDVSKSQQICKSRLENNYPATELNLPILEKIDRENNSATSNKTSWEAILDVLETAVTSSSGSFTIESKESRSIRRSLLEQLSTLADIDITNNDSTLESLGLSEYKVYLLRSFLQDMYNVSLSDEKILKLTAKSIQNLENTLVWTGFKKPKGLKSYFTYVDSNELLASASMVLMQTRVFSKGVDEFDANKQYLCVIPGLEGHYKKFEVLCERLKMPALVLQPGFDHTPASIEEQARRYAEILIKKMKLKDNFYLLGYESGVIVALEIASILEDNGQKGTVFCVGPPPDELQDNLRNDLDDFDTDDKLQNVIIKTLSDVALNDTADIGTIFYKFKTLDEKIENVARMVMHRTGSTTQYIRGVLKSAIARVENVLSYVSRPLRLRSKIVMLCDDSKSSRLLQNYSQQAVDVYNLRTPLTHLPKDLRCASIINQHLSADLIEAFEKKNRCEAYHINTNKLLFKQCPE